MAQSDTDLAYSAKEEKSDSSIRGENASTSPDDSGSGTSGWILLMTVVALALSMFLVRITSHPFFVCVLLMLWKVSLDMTIVATAIPKITDEFGGIELVGWYGSAFFITLGSFQASWGKTYKYFPLKPAFLVAIVLFEVGSLMCGVARNNTTLIVGRAITGLGGAGISSGAFTIIALSAPPKQRPAYIGILGASYGIAAAVGPLLGGAFTSHVSWRWCFYINLPIGGVAGGIILLLYRAPPPLPFLGEPLREKLLQLDFPGTMLLVGAMVCYVLALEWGGISRPWSDSTVIGTLVGFGVLLLSYMLVQWYQKDRAAMIGRLLRERNVFIAMIYIHLLAGTFFLLVYYLPIYFQVISGVSAADSGVRNLPLILAQSVATVSSGLVLSRVGYAAPFLLSGAAITAIGSGLLYTLKVGSGSGEWIGFQILTGLGVGWCFQVPVVTAQAAVSPEDLPSVTSMVLTVQTIGGAIFVSAGQSALSNVLLRVLPRESPDLDPLQVVTTGATELRATFPSDQIPGILTAYMEGIKAAFIIATVASSLATVS
ncbi:putative MFS multidrug transporter [Aspergillus steynii IBT 23096]|uniref:Putative MFS multidrug transporter n=1 Tax=Aspergillus steynii IBT 23096 TaxID=1392250 RepID=A0A2I2GFP0_9EURO|nr:putative MFS multidrug transporter [Aspergillus steynii IBT 23096]PLB51671.1 putative MFS multidrug transporter [Aspergillus steynii IBT 23096]